MLDVRRLGLLVALDRHGTIAAASEELHLTASGISMQLRTLERELGVRLTERRGRRLALTPAGLLLVEHGRQVLDRLALAELEVQAVRSGAVGTYRIAAFPSAARTLVADALRRLASDSALTLLLTTPEPEGALAALVAGGTDLAVVHAYSTVPRRLPAGVIAAPVLSEPVWLAMRDDDPAAAESVDLRSLSSHAWITPEHGLTCFEMVDRACGLAGFRPRVVAESADFAVQLQLVAAGSGVALIPDLAAVDVPAGVRLVRPRAPVQRHTSAVIRASSQGDPGLARIITAIVEAARARRAAA